DAIALAGRRRAVVEHMTLVSAATGADELGPDHAVAGVGDGPQMPLGKWLGEARPTGPAFELGAAVEQRQAAQPAGEDARPLLVQKNATERPLGPMLEQHVPLFV